MRHRFTLQAANDLEGIADAIADQLGTLVEEWADAPPARLRELIGRMVDRIDLR